MTLYGLAYNTSRGIDNYSIYELRLPHLTIVAGEETGEGGEFMPDTNGKKHARSASIKGRKR